MNTFDQQGFNVTFWQPQYFYDDGLLQKAIDYIVSRNANVVFLDYAVNFADDGTVIPFGSSQQFAVPLDRLYQVVEKFKQRGLDVFLKPHITDNDSVDNRNLTNTDPSIFKAENFFPAWSSYLNQVLEHDKKHLLDGLVFGTEFNVHDWAHRDQWTRLIGDIRSKFDGQLTYDALLNLYSANKDIKDVVFWDLLDFIGVSFYIPLSNSTEMASWENPSLTQLTKSFETPIYGDIGNTISYLNTTASKYNKQLMLLETGYSSYKGNLKNVNAFWDGVQPVDLLAQYKGIEAVLDTSARYEGNWLKGLSFWEVSLYHFLGDTNSQQGTIGFDTAGKPAQDLIREFYTGQRSYADNSYFGLNLSDTINAGDRGDRIYGLQGNDWIFAGKGDDHISAGPNAVDTNAGYTLTISASSDILKSVAAEFSLYLNNQFVKTLSLEPIEAGRNSNFGNLPYTSTQSFRLELPFKQLENLKITHNNDSYEGFGLDRNLTIYSLTIDGVSADQATSIYRREDGINEVGSWYLHAGGELEFGIDQLQQELAESQQDRDTVYGADGNDWIQGGVGDDRIDGGEGTDTAVYSGLIGDYKVSVGSTVSVSDTRVQSDGTDQLTNIERLEFTDTNLALDTDGVAGKAYRIYKAAFDRAPDVKGLGYWINDMDGGRSLTTVAAGFIASDEFQSRYGAAVSDAGFITLLYANVLDRTPDQSGLDYWINDMKMGLSRAAVLASFSESDENQRNVSDLIANGIGYTPFIS